MVCSVVWSGAGADPSYILTIVQQDGAAVELGSAHANFLAPVAV